jgi:hypothetical protein
VAVDATGREINPGDFVRYIDDDDGFFPGIYRVQRIECGGIRIFLFDSGWQWLRSLWFFTGATPTEAAHRRSEFLDRSAHGAAAGVVVTRGDAA